jgi:hypothetical protein
MIRWTADERGQNKQMTKEDKNENYESIFIFGHPWVV